MRRRLSLLFVMLAGPLLPAGAQTPPAAHELLALVPSDVSFCLVVNDLRGHWHRLEQAPWMQALQRSPLGQAFRNVPEGKDLARFERDVKEHLGIDFQTVRDDLLGDAVVLAYRGPSAGPSVADGEQGLALVKVRRPDVLAKLIDRVNHLQKQSGELQSLDVRDHKGVTYYRRAHAKNTHYYFVQGAVFGLTSSETLLHAVLDKQGEAGSIRSALRQADAERSMAAVWLNPRAFDGELIAKAKAAGPEGPVLKNLLTYWRALDAVVLALDVHDNVELRLSMLARPGDLPPSARAWFATASRNPELWQRLPSSSVLIVAGRTDFKALADGVIEATPAGVRKPVVDALSKGVGAALGFELDLLKDVLPNVGPDWGVCVLPAGAGKEFPQALAALAVKPGDKEVAVDQSLYGAIQFFAKFAVLQHNFNHPADPISIRTLKQGNVEIKYLAQEKLFPAGFQPACALKDGYLLVATSPAAIAQFERQKAPVPASEEAPIIRFAPVELAKLLRLHRERVLEQMTANGAKTKIAAAQEFDDLLCVLDLCRGVTLSQRSGEGRLTWLVRLQMMQ